MRKKLLKSGGKAQCARHTLWKWLPASAALVVLAACGGGSDEAPNTLVDTAVTVEEPIQAGLANMALSSVRAVIGEKITIKFTGVPLDSRNSVTGYAIKNPTAGGSAPQIATDGSIIWTPNAADINTFALKIDVNLAKGDSIITMSLPVNVYQKKLEMSQNILATQSTYSDPEGIYTVTIGIKPGSTPSGKIELHSYRDTKGSVNYSVSSTDPNVVGMLTDSPPSGVVAGGITAQNNTSKANPNPDLHVVENELNEFGVEAIGSLIDRSAVGSGIDLYTLRSDNRLLYPESEEYSTGMIKWSSPVKNQQILQIDASCNLRNNKCTQSNSPVILIHGFNPEIFGIGGGSGTWGAFPKKLIAAGHDVFEFRWITHLRFEEAAGQLANLINSVASKTGKKPIIIAHSFGGIVSHLALSGQGIEWRNEKWTNVKIGKTFPSEIVKRLITLGSPIGGIYDGENNSQLHMVWGRQDGDRTINGCFSITCIQAGASDGKKGNLVKAVGAARQLRPDLHDYDTYSDFFSAQHTYYNDVSSETNLDYAESIARIGKFSTGLIGVPAVDKINPVLHGVETIALVGVGSSGLDPITDPIGKLGDGLISLQGQIHPNDVAFLDSFFKRSDLIKKADMFLEPVRSPKVPGMKYLFVGNVGHTNSSLLHINSSLHEFPEPYVSESGKVKYCKEISHKKSYVVKTGILLCESAIVDIDHPLVQMINNENYLKFRAIDFVQPTLPMPWSVKGKARIDSMNTAAVSIIPFAVDVRDASTGDRILRSFQYQTASDGSFTIDLSQLLDTSLAGFSRANIYANLYFGDGVTYDVQRTTIRNLNSDEINIPEIVLRPIANRLGMINVTGRVINGLTASEGIADAIVRMKLGAGLAASALQNIPNSNTSRTFGTDASGNFTLSQIRPGVYSALVKKAGFVEEVQGRVTVSANNVITLSLLPTLTAGQASVTLRWDTAAGGANVVSDLDSHFLRFTNANLDYHISYGNRTGLNGDNLDRDDRDYEGPETITFAPQQGKNYVYYVHQYTTRGNIPDSKPVVIVRNGAQSYRFDLPVSTLTTARYWRVFDMRNGQVVPCALNCLQNSAPTALSTQSSWGVPLSVDVRAYLNNVPAKM